jgi:hypothetical protein
VSAHRRTSEILYRQFDARRAKRVLIKMIGE